MKNEVIRFRCTDKQKEKIQIEAWRLGLTMSAYITMILTKETSHEKQANNKQTTHN